LGDLKSTDLRSNTDSNIRVSDNESAAQILQEGFIDLSRKDIKVDAFNIEDLSLLGHSSQLS
jgi:hypothetical protein